MVQSRFSTTVSEVLPLISPREVRSISSKARLQFVYAVPSHGSVNVKLSRHPWFVEKKPSSSAISDSSNSFRRISHWCKGPADSLYLCSSRP